MVVILGSSWDFVEGTLRYSHVRADKIITPKAPSPDFTLWGLMEPILQGLGFRVLYKPLKPEGGYLR